MTYQPNLAWPASGGTGAYLPQIYYYPILNPEVVEEIRKIRVALEEIAASLKAAK